ncbi:MAG: CCA tRNA nucleotidyltransferase [Deltaproteobacteria bacterium]|nr:CCA tRNA nucleotidyltransferase [Deltaproteobacteria bacterium]
MRDLWSIASSDRVIAEIADLLLPDTYLVGGCIRDMLLVRQPHDFDIVTFSPVWSFAKEVASRFGASAFWMDQSREIARIVVKDNAVTIDITPPKGSDIEEDLKHRDITINAMAFSFSSRKFIDPLDGLRDLGNKIIRVISANALVADPLRVLRCLRFAITLDFSIQVETVEYLKRYASGIRDVSPERIKQELLLCLNEKQGSRLFGMLDTFGLLEELFPYYQDLNQGLHHRWPLKRHVIETANEIDNLLNEIEAYLPEIGEYFSEPIEAGASRAALLRLGAFLHDIGKPETMSSDRDGRLHFYQHAIQGTRLVRSIARELTFAAKSCDILSGIVEHHMRLLDLACQGDISNRAMHRFLKTTQGYVPEILVHALADAWATGKDPGYVGSRPDMERVISKVWSYYLSTYLQQTLSPLIDGHDVMHILKIEPGPQIGACLKMVEEARAEGFVSTRIEALNYLQNIKLGQ